MQLLNDDLFPWRIGQGGRGKHWWHIGKPVGKKTWTSSTRPFNTEEEAMADLEEFVMHVYEGVKRSFYEQEITIPPVTLDVGQLERMEPTGWRKFVGKFFPTS